MLVTSILVEKMLSAIPKIISQSVIVLLTLRVILILNANQLWVVSLIENVTSLKLA
jgi:hypothetical protein